MNEKTAFLYLSVGANRNAMINKITYGFKHDVSFTKDAEVEQFQKDFLRHWNNLEEFPSAAKDLKGLSGKELKDKKKELQMNFCRWITSDEALAEGYAYAAQKKEAIKDSVSKSGKSLHKKLKSAVSLITGKEKIGRNEPCPCESGLKYKKCCGANK